MRKDEKLMALAKKKGYKYHSGKVYEEIEVVSPDGSTFKRFNRIRDERINAELKANKIGVNDE